MTVSLYVLIINVDGADYMITLIILLGILINLFCDLLFLLKYIYFFLPSEWPNSVGHSIKAGLCDSDGDSEGGL